MEKYLYRAETETPRVRTITLMRQRTNARCGTPPLERGRRWLVSQSFERIMQWPCYCLMAAFCPRVGKEGAHLRRYIPHHICSAVPARVSHLRQQLLHTGRRFLWEHLTPQAF